MPRSERGSSHPTGGIPIARPTRRALLRARQYAAGDTANIPEASFQYDVEMVARANGWRIDYSHTQPTSRIYRFLTACFPRKGIEAVRKFLLSRRTDMFTLCYHTHDSRNSQAGFPDLVMVHPERPQIVFAELKKDNEYPSNEQRLWAAGILCVADEYPDAVRYFLWKPKHYPEIVEALGGIDPLKYR